MRFSYKISMSFVIILSLCAPLLGAWKRCGDSKSQRLITVAQRLHSLYVVM